MNPTHNKVNAAQHKQTISSAGNYSAKPVSLSIETVRFSRDIPELPDSLAHHPPGSKKVQECPSGPGGLLLWFPRWYLGVNPLDWDEQDKSKTLSCEYQAQPGGL